MIINAIGDAMFTFLPLYLGYTASKKFGLKPMIGLTIGAIMCYPANQRNAKEINIDRRSKHRSLKQGIHRLSQG